MRVLFWAPGFYRVGDHFRCTQFAVGLASRGHDVTCLLGDRRLNPWFRHSSADGVRFVQPPYVGELAVSERLWECQPDTRLPFDSACRALWVAAMGRKYDIIHSFHIGPNSLMPFLAARRFAPKAICVQDWCDLWTGGILRSPGASLSARLDYRLSTGVEGLSIRRATALTVNSSYLEAKATAEFGLEPSRVLKVVEGSDVHIVTPRDKRSCRQSLELPVDVTLIAYSAFFSPDTELLLAAVQRLARSSARERICLLWIGPTDGALRSRIRALGLQDSIRCVGPVSRSDLGTYLGACDFCVLPFSDRPVNLARWPAKLGDYLAAGRAVVTNAVGEVGDFFRTHPGIGLATAPEPRAFSEGIRLMAEQPESQADYGAKARAVARRFLDSARSVEALETFYLGL